MPTEWQTVPLRNKRVLLGVSGGIAAYKSVEVLRRLQAAGAEVRVAMTASAQEFVAPLTFEALSHHRVYTELFPRTGDPDVLHVMLGAWADLTVVAPATANLLGRLAGGLADDLLTCTLLAAHGRVLLAPAMESHMYSHPSVQRNLGFLRDAGYLTVGPAEGELASGAEGVGRLAEPSEIVSAAVRALSCQKAFSGRHVLVTAGRTEEDIDPVRFITNRSTGRMGFAVARQAWARGASVTLVAGPTAIEPPDGVKVVRVRTVAEMRAATSEAFETADALVMTAAVLDFRPSKVATSKIKKADGAPSLELVATEDFLVTLGGRKGERVVVGFAMETGDGVANARAKLEAKHLDLIVLNDLTVEGAGFAVDTNVVSLIEPSGDVSELPRMPKDEVAEHILDWIGRRWSPSAD